MRRYPLMMLVLLTLAGMVGGCATSAKARWVQQRETISITQDTATQLHAENAIGDDALLSIHPWLKSARKHNGKAYFLLDTAPDQADIQMDMADKQLLLATLFLGGSSRD